MPTYIPYKSTINYNPVKSPYAPIWFAADGTQYIIHKMTYDHLKNTRDLLMRNKSGFPEAINRFHKEYLALFNEELDVREPTRKLPVHDQHNARALQRVLLGLPVEKPYPPEINTRASRVPSLFQ